MSPRAAPLRGLRSSGRGACGAAMPSTARGDGTSRLRRPSAKLLSDEWLWRPFERPTVSGGGAPEGLVRGSRGGGRVGRQEEGGRSVGGGGTGPGCRGRPGVGRAGRSARSLGRGGRSRLGRGEGLGSEGDRRSGSEQDRPHSECSCGGCSGDPGAGKGSAHDPTLRTNGSACKRSGRTRGRRGEFSTIGPRRSARLVPEGRRPLGCRFRRVGEDLPGRRDHGSSISVVVGAPGTRLRWG